MYPPILTAEQFSTGTNGLVPVNDPRLPLLLGGATSAIRRYCGWHVTPEAPETFTLDGEGGQILSLPTLRLVDVFSVLECGRIVDPGEYEWSTNGELRKLSGWTGVWRGITVICQHGFDAPDLAQVVQQIVANALASPLGVTREQAGQVSVAWSSTAPGVSGGISLLERDLNVLNQYRLPRKA